MGFHFCLSFEQCVINCGFIGKYRGVDFFAAFVWSKWILPFGSAEGVKPCYFFTNMVVAGVYVRDEGFETEVNWADTIKKGFVTSLLVKWKIQVS